MNSETRGQDENDEMTSLVVRRTRELSARASLVIRGLQDIKQSIQTDASRLADEAVKLHGLGKFDEAVTVCNSGLGTDLDFDVVLLQIKGASLAKQGHLVEGLECVDEALKLKPEDPFSWYVKSRLFRMADRTKEQLKCLQRVIEIDPNHKGAWKEIGDSLLKLGSYEESVQAFHSALEQNPADEYCRSQMDIAIGQLTQQREAELLEDVLPETAFLVVYGKDQGWHVIKDEDSPWELERTFEDGQERWRPLQPLFGPFLSNYDPNEGLVGSGRELAEAFAEEQRKLYPNGPIREGQTS